MYSIVIITYHTRFETWLKPLVKEIKRQRPDVEIVLCVNGEKDYFNETYRKKLLTFIKTYSNIYPLIYPRFRSIAKLWNLGVQFSSNDVVLMFNDDLILEDGFFDEYEKALETQPTFSINITSSALSIHKYALMDINWFDERYLGIGWEDADMMLRYQKSRNLAEFPNVNIESCKNVANSEFYKVHNEKLAEQIQNEKPEDRIAGQIRDQRFGRYSEFNRTLNLDNPQLQYPYERFYLENKHKL